jgi:hypothetical protein
LTPRTARLPFVLAAAFSLVVAAGCGKKADPAPPAPAEADTASAPVEADTAAAPEPDTAAAPEPDTATALEPDTEPAAAADATAPAPETDQKVETADLTGLTPPLTLRARVTREPLPKEGGFDCHTGTLSVDVEDAAGVKRTLKVGPVTGMAEEGAALETVLVPNAAGGYEDLGVFCAGLQSGWSIAHEGDTLVATDTWSDEETGPGTKAWVLAKLPAGAVVDAK